MSFAAYKIMQWPTGIDNSASGFIAHSGADFFPRMPPIHTEDLESDWASALTSARYPILSSPPLIFSNSTLSLVRVQEEGSRESSSSAEPKQVASWMASPGPLSSWFLIIGS